MKTKEDFIQEIKVLAINTEANIRNFSTKVVDAQTLHQFYDRCLEQFYKFMPCYCFMLPFHHLSEEEMFEINQFGLDKSDELHKLYSRIYVEKRNAIDMR